MNINPSDTVSVPIAAIDGLPAHTASALRFCAAWTLLETAFVEQDGLPRMGAKEHEAALTRIVDLRERAQRCADVAHNLFVRGVPTDVPR